MQDGNRSPASPARRREQEVSEEEDDDEEAERSRRGYGVKRCPESRSLQTLLAAPGRPGRMARWDPSLSRFFQGGSLPCIQEKDSSAGSSRQDKQADDGGGHLHLAEELTESSPPTASRQPAVIETVPGPAGGSRDEALQLAQRQRGFVRQVALHMEWLLSASQLRRALLTARAKRPPPLPGLQDEAKTLHDGTLPGVQRQGSESLIIPLHGPGLELPSASRRFQSHDSSTSSSDTSSSPHFEEEATALQLLQADWARHKLAALHLARPGVPGVPGVYAMASERMPSIASCCCRICQNSTSMERLISPCHCKGSLAYVHLSCLERWLNLSGQTHCELCQFQYSAVQTPRFTLCQSLRIWFRHPRNRRQLLADTLIGGILTLVTLGLLAVTSVGMRYFVAEGAKLGISAYTSQGTILFFLMFVGTGYLVTVFLLVKDQVTPWLRWRRTNVNVRLTLDTLTTPPPARRSIAMPV